MRRVVAISTGNRDTDYALRQVADSVRELQDATRPVVRAAVRLLPGVETEVSHTLGRAPIAVSLGPVMGALTIGMVERVTRPDSTRAITLKATGFGATITVDVVLL